MTNMTNKAGSHFRNRMAVILIKKATAFAMAFS